ncbi:MAG TPA: hypothetical protein VIL71_06090, partial [Spirillospora sp.]
HDGGATAGPFACQAALSASMGENAVIPIAPMGIFDLGVIGVTERGTRIARICRILWGLMADCGQGVHDDTGAP